MALNDIWHFAPKSWHRAYEDNQFDISAGSDEFKDVENDLKKAVKNLKRIVSMSRVQNIYDFGQFLMRGQILATENPSDQYYEVRRYVVIPSSCKNIALKHNLDHRRLELGALTFKSHLDHVSRHNTIFVVKILTDNPKERSIEPYNFTEYYIDYVVEIE